MLSFGIEYDRAFSIAFWSARLPAGSDPPSFAATMIARDSFEKSLPRFASAAPFLCLIDDHLLWPDIEALLDSVGKVAAAVGPSGASPGGGPRDRGPCRGVKEGARGEPMGSPTPGPLAMPGHSSPPAPDRGTARVPAYLRSTPGGTRRRGSGPRAAAPARRRALRA